VKFAAATIECVQKKKKKKKKKKKQQRALQVELFAPNHNHLW